MAAERYGEGRLIGSVEKNPKEHFYVRLVDYRGFKLIDLRRFFKADDGVFRPTSDGIAMRQDRIGELRRLLEEAERVAAEDDA